MVVGARASTSCSSSSPSSSSASGLAVPAGGGGVPLSSSSSSTSGNLVEDSTLPSNKLDAAEVIIDKMVWPGTLEDDEEWLQRAHHGQMKSLRLEMDGVPMSGDEGFVQGQMLEQMKDDVFAMEKELMAVKKVVEEQRALKHLAAAPGGED